MVSYDNCKDETKQLKLRLGDFEVVSVFVSDKNPIESMLGFNFENTFYKGTRRIFHKSWTSYSYMIDEFEIEKKKIFLPKKMRKNFEKRDVRGRKGLYFKEVPEELQIIEAFLQEWIELYRFCKGNEGMEDYLGMWHLPQFVDDMFEDFVLLYIELIEKEEISTKMVKLQLRNDATFNCVEDDAEWLIVNKQHDNIK